MHYINSDIVAFKEGNGKTVTEKSSFELDIYINNKMVVIMSIINELSNEEIFMVEMLIYLDEDVV